MISQGLALDTPTGPIYWPTECSCFITLYVSPTSAGSTTLIVRHSTTVNSCNPLLDAWERKLRHKIEAIEKIHTAFAVPSVVWDLRRPLVVRARQSLPSGSQRAHYGYSSAPRRPGYRGKGR